MNKRPIWITLLGLLVGAGVGVPVGAGVGMPVGGPAGVRVGLDVGAAAVPGVVEPELWATTTVYSRPHNGSWTLPITVLSPGPVNFIVKVYLVYFVAV